MKFGFKAMIFNGYQNIHDNYSIKQTIYKFSGDVKRIFLVKVKPLKIILQCRLI